MKILIFVLDYEENSVPFDYRLLSSLRSGLVADFLLEQRNPGGGLEYS